MHCPYCLKQNLYNKLILLPNLYVCEYESCNFCETPERFEELYNKHNLKVSNIKENSYYETNYLINDDTSEHLSGNSEISINNYNLNQSDLQCQTLENLEINDFQSVDECENNNCFEQLYQQFHNNCENLLNSDLVNNNSQDLSYETLQYDNIDNGLNSNVFSNFNKQSLQEKEFMKINDSKSKMIEIVAVNNPKFWLINCDNKMVNMSRLPYYFQSKSKIFQLLLLHLDIFSFMKDIHIDELKYEYAIIESFANNCSTSVVKYLSYNLLDKLYNIMNNHRKKNHHSDSFDKEIIYFIKILIRKYDNANNLKMEYTTDISCNHCHESKTKDTSNYYLKLKEEFLVKAVQNKLIYDIDCFNCQKKASKTITFNHVPQFVIIHHNGECHDDIDSYENVIVSSDNKKLSVIAVVECASDFHRIECFESYIDKTTYIKKSLTKESMENPNYCVHIKNTRGWYRFHDKKDFLSSPSTYLSLNNKLNVRLVILGTPSDPNNYQDNNSLETFIKTNENYLRSYLTKVENQSTFHLVCQRMLNNPRRKTKPKTRLMNKLSINFKNDEFIPDLSTNMMNCEVDLDADDNIELFEQETEDMFDFPNVGIPLSCSTEKSSSDYYSPSLVSNECSMPVTSITNAMLVNNSHNYQDHHKKLSATTTTSSGVSSCSSMLESSDNYRRPSTISFSLHHKSNQNYSFNMSTKSINQSSILINNRQHTQKRTMSIDDLINKHCKKRKTY